MLNITETRAKQIFAITCGVSLGLVLLPSALSNKTIEDTDTVTEETTYEKPVTETAVALDEEIQVTEISENKAVSNIEDDKYDIVEDDKCHNKCITGEELSDIQSCYLDNIRMWYNGIEHIGFADLNFDEIPELITWGNEFTVYSCDLETRTLTKQVLDGISVDSEINVYKDNVSGNTSWYSITTVNDDFLVTEINYSPDGVSSKDIIDVHNEDDGEIYYFDSVINTKTYCDILMSFTNQYSLIGADNIFVKSKELGTDVDYIHVVSVLLNEYYR
jgi:hypothetical protein